MGLVYQGQGFNNGFVTKFLFPRSLSGKFHDFFQVFSRVSLKYVGFPGYVTKLDGMLFGIDLMRTT